MSWSIRHFASVQVRQLSISRFVQRPALSADYKAKDLWHGRFQCDLLSTDQNIIKTINAKILTGSKLNNLEVDVFINIAAPRQGDIAQLQEAARALKNFRKTLSAHTLLPSTPHAICRLFLDSEQVESLVRLLEKRVEFGLFPDPFVMNLLFDSCLEKNKLALASRLAALIMLQEEFGQDQLNDNFALYSIAKYIESKTDFNDWTKSATAPDSILDPTIGEQAMQAAAEEKPVEEAKAEEDGDGDQEDEEDAEYIRIPFLRNPYNDHHFDLTNPRQICGTTLSMLGRHLSNQLGDHSLGDKCQMLGEVLLARWADANEAIKRCVQSKVPADVTFRDTIKFYLDNLHDLNAPDDKTKSSILSQLDKLPKCELSISHEADMRHSKLKDLEKKDIAKLRQDINNWSQIRHATKQAQDDYEAKQRLIAEIKAKKEELRLREQYLYFYDNLKKTNLSRINYD